MRVRKVVITGMVVGGLLAAGSGCGNEDDAPSAPGSRFSGEEKKGDTQDSNIYKTLDKNLEQEDKEQKQEAASE